MKKAMTFGPFVDMVKEGMRSRRMTLRHLCRVVALDPSFLSKVLLGKRSPPRDEEVLRRIAGALGLEPPQLIVAAGKIPFEWARLWKDKNLFGDVNRLAAHAQVASRKSQVTSHKWQGTSGKSPVASPSMLLRTGPSTASMLSEVETLRAGKSRDLETELL